MNQHVKHVITVTVPKFADDVDSVTVACIVAANYDFILLTCSLRARCHRAEVTLATAVCPTLSLVTTAGCLLLMREVSESCSVPLRQFIVNFVITIMNIHNHEWL